ncbi:unnamed protein product [Ixodes hexagonus]
MPVKPSMKTFFFKLHCGALPVKPWLEAKGFFVPWSVNCLLCKVPESIEHVFIDCWDAVFLWDVLQRMLKKDLPLTAHGIRFLPLENEGGIPYDIVTDGVTRRLWRTRTGVHNADVNVRSAREYFIESVAYIREVYRSLPGPPDWLRVLDDLFSLKRF